MVAWIALALALGNLTVVVALAVGVRVFARRYRPMLEPWLALLAPMPAQGSSVESAPAERAPADVP